jgi:hypothetical protein
VTVADKPMTDKETAELDRFLELVRNGVGKLNAAIEVGWSPAKLRRFEKDPEFIELLEVCRERRLEGYEQTLHELADKGHFRALQMVLFNERGDRWKDVRHIQVERHDTLDVGVVVSVKQSALELLREQGVASLQPAAPDAIDVESHESSAIEA